MGAFSLTHWLVLIIILLIFFGPTKPSALFKAFGKAIKNFKDAKNEIELKPGKDYVEKSAEGSNDKATSAKSSPSDN